MNEREPISMSDYQRGYVDGFDAPANVEARERAAPAIDVERLRALAERLRAALTKTPYHRNPQLPTGHPFGYPPEGHREYTCPVCLALMDADDVLGEFDFEADPDYQAAAHINALRQRDNKATWQAGNAMALAILQAEEPAPAGGLEERLARLYMEGPTAVALICDEALDRSGALLGRVRERARSLRAIPG